MPPNLEGKPGESVSSKEPGDALCSRDLEPDPGAAVVDPEEDSLLELRPDHPSKRDHRPPGEAGARVVNVNQRTGTETESDLGRERELAFRHRALNVRTLVGNRCLQVEVLVDKIGLDVLPVGRGEEEEDAGKGEGRPKEPHHHHHQGSTMTGNSLEAARARQNNN